MVVRVRRDCVVSSSLPIALVDFPEVGESTPSRLRFERPTCVLRAETLGEVIATIDEAERLAREGSWVVGFVSYDASPAFDASLVALHDPTLPFAWFAAFDAPRADSVGQDAPTTLGAFADADVSGRLAAETTIASAEHAAHVARIHEYIAAGDVYQVNLTLPFTAASSSSSLCTYERMRAAQRGAYSAYLDLGDAQIMSASPELFLERAGSRVRSKPMKGTSPRGLHSTADERAVDTLCRSEKERAENVMIVDVVRNDLGRVGQLGSVQVPALCIAERFPSVWQLTSSVVAEVEPDVSLSRLFGALFPAASITGAPKIRATEIIAELEQRSRGVYCGAVGLIRPGGDATFNVAIRTAWTVDHGRTVHLDAGGGITIDSAASAEMSELRTKLSAFTTPAPMPELFETIRVERGRPVRFERHLDRMEDSARYFGMSFDREAARLATIRAAADAAELPMARSRLLLDRAGSVSATIELFDQPASDNTPRVVALARSPVMRDNVLLYHKTTSRTLYDVAMTCASRGRDVPPFDVILWNEAGEATELTRGNLVAEIGGTRWTPPIECGLLAGTLRAELLERGEIRERILTLDDVARADRLWFLNSLRGWVPIVLLA